MRSAAILVVSTFVLAVGAASAPAAPSGTGLGTISSTCGGTPATITHSAGASFWVGDTHYVPTSIAGTFTPVGGGAPESFTTTYGQRTGLTGGTISCSATQVFPEGTFTLNATGAAVR